MRLKEECHMCNRPLPNSHLATCSSKLCRAQFCIPCVQTNYYKVLFKDIFINIKTLLIIQVFLLTSLTIINQSINL